LARRVAVAAGLAMLALAAGAAAVLSERAPRLAYSNSVPVSSFVAVLAPGAQLCQPHQVIPAGAASAQVFAGVYYRPGPPLDLVVRSGGLLVAAGHAAAGYPDRYLRIPVRKVRRTAHSATVCLRNAGDHKVALAGRREPPSGTRIGRRALQARVYVAWFRPGREAWWDLGRPIAQRFGVAKAGFMGTWTFWAVLGLVVATWALALAILVGRWRR